jgi:Clathrin adaptor complex small chain
MARCASQARFLEHWRYRSDGPPRTRTQLCNFVDWASLKLVYKRYASLFFVAAIDPADNELLALDMIHHFVEVLDKHFSNVCELDLVFHFYKAYWLIDEVFLAGAPPAANVHSAGSGHPGSFVPRHASWQLCAPQDESGCAGMPAE